MTQGISTNKPVTAKAACLKNAGISFVCRYYSRTTKFPEKRLTVPEANAIIAAGMQILTVYEDKPTDSGYFNYGRGLLDGKSAHDYAAGVGQPAGSAIYFAVDYDATPGDVQGVITQYFQGVRDGLAEKGGGAAHYVVGIYGSGRACAAIKETRGLAAFSWLAESTGWAGYKTYATADVRQAKAGHSLCGLDTDDYERNAAPGNFGGFGALGGGAAPAAAAAVPAAPAAPAAAAPAAGGSAAAPAAPDYPQRVVARALKQYELYHPYEETDETLADQIRNYWEDIGYSFPGVGTAWSAVFVSWCMREGQDIDNGFKKSSAHSRFVYKAIHDKRDGKGEFHAYRITEAEAAPEPGDIIHNNRGGASLTYDFAAAHKAYESHSAIVVETGTDASGRYAMTVGGNESQSVRIRRVALNADGKVVQRTSNPYICVIKTLKK